MNHYDILGIKKEATKKEIKDAYKKLIKKYHPDVYPGDKSFAEKKTQDINLAYDILSNEQTKQAYDIEISTKTPPLDYNYTPPKYNNPRYYSYQNYYTSSNFENYKKSQNINTTSQKNIHDEFSENILNKISIRKKLIILILIIFIYILLFIITFFKLNSLLNGQTSGTILNTKKTNTAINTINTPKDENYNYYYTNNNYNINDYISEDTLHTIYTNYYSTIFGSYDEFKEYISDYLYYNYNF